METLFYLFLLLAALGGIGIIVGMAVAVANWSWRPLKNIVVPSVIVGTIASLMAFIVLIVLILEASDH